MTALFISHSSKDNAWAAQLGAALRAAGYRSLFLDFHPEDGIHAGAVWERTLYARLRQCRGVVALCGAHWLASSWCIAETILAREKGKPVFLLATAEVAGGDADTEASGSVPRIPDFLRGTQFISLARVTPEQALACLCAGLSREGLSDDFPPPVRPYPGLEPFSEADAAVFFGRDADIARVCDTLNRWRGANARGFIVVLGASGCGKSSLVRAGVLPRLKRAGKGGGARGRWLVPEPVRAGKGLDGLALALADAFAEAGPPAALAAVRERLGPVSIDDATRALTDLANEFLLAHRLPEAHVLLVLDQLEEAFGTAPGSDARRLLELLLCATRRPGSPVAVLATMRSDFLNAFQLFPGASGGYEGITLDPMPAERFGEVIAEPARRFGLELEPGLKERLVQDTGANDALPLLAFTLEKLYERCAPDGPLTLQAYEALFPPVLVREEGGGTTEYRGVAAAIKHEADRILVEAGYRDLPADAPRLADLRRAFYRLARIGEEGQCTRRSAPWSAMPASCRPVLERFVGQRLLVAGAEGGGPALSVAHEALFRVWDTLRGWLAEDARALQLRAQIEDAAREWDEAGRSDSGRAPRWPEGRVMDSVREIEHSGVSLEDVTDPDRLRAFLGPTAREALEELPALAVGRDADAGSGRYGEAWRLPLGHEARASVGVRLALLGDRRRGVGLREDGLPDIDWCAVAGGEITIEIRANPDDPSSAVADTLSQRVEGFRIARYPVTVAQFQAFVHACHRDGQWRLPPGFPLEFPVDYPPPKHRARYPNHPADTVNWQDALAFCHWLSASLGYEVRLPNEFEWQQAATGGDPRRTYPWGPDWDPAKEPWRANTLEGGLGRSTAVGMYPAGASSGGVLDMAGTVWEWCLNRFDEPSDVSPPTSQDSLRAVRGGSWSSVQLNTRCTVRDRYYPKPRYNNFGFRLVCSSPIFDR